VSMDNLLRILMRRDREGRRSVLRVIAERMSRGVVVKRFLPSDFNHAPLFVTPDAALSFWKLGLAKSDRNLLAIAQEHVKRGDVVWDVGANIGLFSMAAAQLAGPSGFVLAIEPDIWLASLIGRSAQLRQNRHLNLRVLAAAVSESVGVATLVIAVRGRASNALEIPGPRSQAGGIRMRQLTPTVSLDSLIESQRSPRILKIDVEGAEVMVLRGARRLLAEIRPIVYCEVGEENAEQVTELLTSTGYKLFDGDVPRQERLEIKSARWSTLGYPT
jgi:FkbM family methyltransferase